MTSTFRALALVALAAGVTACGDDTPTSPSTAAPGPGQGTQTIVGLVVQEDGEFDVLQAAVIRAGLAETLAGTGPFTVFAPTDAAFATTLGVANEAAAIAAVNGLPVETLRGILLFHVTSGRLDSTSVLATASYPMLNGQALTRAQLQAAGLVQADIAASNGVVHVVGAVLMPPS
jgi:uncharacterized surface protein with fasciclin (FAS1) repeats